MECFSKYFILKIVKKSSLLMYYYTLQSQLTVDLYIISIYYIIIALNMTFTCIVLLFTMLLHVVVYPRNMRVVQIGNIPHNKFKKNDTAHLFCFHNIQCSLRIASPTLHLQHIPSCQSTKQVQLCSFIEDHLLDGLLKHSHTRNAVIQLVWIFTLKQLILSTT